MNEFRPEKLARIRVERGWSLREAAKLTGGTKETINDLERGKRTPHPTTLRKLADGFGVPVTYFLEPTVPKVSSRPSPEAPEEASEEERPIARRVSPEELQREVARLKTYNQRRQNQIDTYDAEGAALPERSWWDEAAALERSLTEEYEEREILPYVEALGEGREMAPWTVHRACVQLARELSIMRDLVKEARIMVFHAEGRVYEQTTRFSSSIDSGLDEWRRGEQPDRYRHAEVTE
jgi:transcriptional regulator with XRE-family HTH domain